MFCRDKKETTTFLCLLLWLYVSFHHISLFISCKRGKATGYPTHSKWRGKVKQRSILKIYIYIYIYNSETESNVSGAEQWHEVKCKMYSTFSVLARKGAKVKAVTFERNWIIKLEVDDSLTEMNTVDDMKISDHFHNCVTAFVRCGLGSSVGIATELRAGRSGIESRWGRDLPPVQTGPVAHPASCTMDTGSFPWVKCGRGVLLTTHPLLVSRSWKSRAITLPTLWATPGL